MPRPILPGDDPHPPINCGAESAGGEVVPTSGELVEIHNGLENPSPAVIRWLCRYALETQGYSIDSLV